MENGYYLAHVSVSKQITLWNQFIRHLIRVEEAL